MTADEFDRYDGLGLAELVRRGDVHVDELLEMTALLSRAGRARLPGSGVGLLTISGGDCTLPSDLAARTGPRAHGTAEAVERARKAVTNRIRQTLAHIANVHHALGLHLRNAVHTGTRCVYTPERPTRWSE